MENKKITIVLIEDSVDDAELIKRKLEKSANTRFQVIVAQKLEDGLKQIEKSEPDLILSDLGLPDSHGLDTVTKILLAVPHIPLVVLSGFDDEDIAIKAVQSGAQDYLVKGRLDNSQLERTIYYSIERARLQYELEQNTQEVSKLHVNLLKVLENSADAIVVVGENLDILFTNPAVESLFGQKPKDLLNQSFPYPLVTDKTSEIEIHRTDGVKTIAEVNVVGISWEGEPAHLVSMHNITKRKEMEEALRASEEKYRNIVELSQEGIITTNLQGVITSCNLTFLGMIGLTQKEIIGKHFKDIPNLNISDLPACTKMFTSLLSGKKNPPMEISWKINNGPTRLFELRSSLMKSDGNIFGVQTLAIDITERKQMERALQESEKKFAAAFHSSPEIIAIVNINDGKYIDINDSYTRVTGYTREELVGHPVNEINMFVYPEESEKMTRLINEQGKMRNEEFSFRTKSGEIRQWLCSAEVINIGGESHIISVATDITERKRAEEALRELSSRQEAILAAVPDIIMEVDNNKVYTWANEAGLEFFGDDVIGKEAGFYFEGDQDTYDKVEPLFSGGKNIIYVESWQRRKDGEKRLLAWWCRVLKDKDDNVTGALSTARDITELRKAEESLRISEEKFSKAFLHSPEVILISDIANGAIAEANDTFLRLSGYTREEVIGKKATELGIWADLDERAATVKTLKEQGMVNNRECHFRMKSGEIRTWLFSAEIINIGNKPWMLSVTTDITERKKVEEKLRFSDTALNSIHEGVFAMDTEFRVTRWNEMCEQLFDIKASDAIGKIVGDIITLVEEYPGQNEKRLNLLLEKGFNKEEQIYRTPRGDIWVDVHAQAIEDNRKRTGWVMLASDITERKKTEQALKQSEEKYRELINTSTDAIISADQRMRVTIWNHGAEKIFGYTEKEMLGQSVLKIVPEITRERMVKGFSHFNKTDSSAIAYNIIESVGLKRNGAEVPLELSVSTRKAGDAYIATAIIRDITTRKEAEEKLRKIDQMKTVFLSNVSHELRTPLQSISGFTKLIMTGKVPDPATQQEFLQIIDRETMHLGNLINSLLDMSRLESGRFEVYRKLTSIHDIIADSIKIFHSLAREKNITLIEDIPANLPEMEADIDRLRQVILNLVGNAMKFSDPGSSVKVKAEIRDGELLFQVVDHGIGIRKEAMTHLFERFYRVEGETVRGGTGLGLYISKQIVEAHNGRIWAESKYGEGSTFSFTLPLNDKGGNKNGKENFGNRRRPGNSKAGRLLTNAGGVSDNHGF